MSQEQIQKDVTKTLESLQELTENASSAEERFQVAMLAHMLILVTFADEIKDSVKHQESLLQEIAERVKPVHHETAHQQEGD